MVVELGLLGLVGLLGLQLLLLLPLLPCMLQHAAIAYRRRGVAVCKAVYYHPLFLAEIAG